MGHIKVDKITNGVYWVQIGALDLRILCATPSDIVKLLIKKKYIRSVIVDDYHFHTGPNAILLCDTPFQNNKGCNFTEFPVLHMLFFQGMFIPNHPNFKKKPLFIGDPEIVEKQLKYLYYGSYGETDKGVLTHVCKSEKLAEELLGMKLKFAYGNFSPYDEIMDVARVSGNEATELKPGLEIKRLEKNVFEFSYQGETAVVDLNLKEGETYESTVQPEHRSLPKGKFLVINSGAGDGWDINRTCFSSMVRFDDKYYCVDFGPSGDKALRALNLEFKDIAGIFQTHIHDDHINGYEYFWFSGNRFRVISCPHIQHSLKIKLRYIFDVDDEELERRIEFVDIEKDVWNNFDGLEVKAFDSAHPVETVNFLFRNYEGDEKKIYAHIGDITSLNVITNRLSKTGPEDYGISAEFRERIISNYNIKAEFKKIDIGGGLIHGDAIDFKDDLSKILSLGHISRALTKEEMKIGILEPFGSAQVLIL